MNEMMTKKSKPFLKWAGGKRWFIDYFPDLLPEKYDNYIEPFLGGGAVFFHLTPKKAFLGDMNEELISTYKAIRDDWLEVWRILKKHQQAHSKEYYYYVRKQKLTKSTTKAARFIYLNRTCFNGLYRVNLQGKFNVPIGTKSTVIFPSDDFEKISHLLKRCTFFTGDFQSLIKTAKEGDLLYIDPPYTVQHNNNNFVKYNEKIFSWQDQIRLSKLVHEARLRGVKIIVSNANHKCVRTLYEGFENILTVDRYSIISGASKYRKKTTELVITNLPNL
jgi:DNA adenine methylase